MEGTNVCVLQLGSNLNDPASQLSAARETINKVVGRIIKESSLYESEPWGNPDLNWFLNQIVVVSTDLGCRELLAICQDIEKELGRSKKTTTIYENRSIDIDIIFFNDDITNETDLCVPHDKIPQRRFVLEPLVELLPQYVHPQLNQSLAYLLDNCEDSLKVNRLD